MKGLLAAIHAVAPALGAAPNLAVDSPFGTQQGAPPVAVRGEVLELRGIMLSADGARYCIFDPSRNSSTWAAVSEPFGNFVIRSADPEGGEVTLDELGRLVTLRLRESKVAALTPEGNAPTHAIAYLPLGRRQPGDPRAPRSGE